MTLLNSGELSLTLFLPLICGVQTVKTRRMSALPPKADMCGALAHVCFGPKRTFVASK
jgi:hypothetical protein